jgi:hypothetical protein
MKVRDSDIAWVWGQRKMRQVLGMFELLFSLDLGFETYEPSISLIF